MAWGEEGGADVQVYVPLVYVVAEIEGPPQRPDIYVVVVEVKQLVEVVEIVDVVVIGAGSMPGAVTVTKMMLVVTVSK